MDDVSKQKFGNKLLLLL